MSDRKDYFSKGFERAVAQLAQRRATERANQTKQDSKPVAKKTAGIINQSVVTKPVITKRMTDEEYQTTLLSKMRALLRARQQTTDNN